MNSRPSLARNALFNFLGSVLPLVVSLATVPMYLEHVGTARYGVLAIVWMLQGYFGFFDLGLAAATSNRVAQLSDAVERESLIWTALILNAVFGAIGGLVLLAAGRFLLAQFHIDVALFAEVVAALPWLACAVPLATVSGVLYGALIGREQFGALNAVQVPAGMLFQIVPLVTAVIVGPDLRHLIAAAILSGAASLLLLVAVVCRAAPLRFSGGPRLRFIRPLFSYGAWVTVTNLLSPLLSTADRLLIGGTLGAQAVAYYQVPLNLALRARILPGVVTRTLFPRLSAIEPASANELTLAAVRGLTAATTPMIVFGIFLMRPFLSLWTGHDFASRSAPVGEAILVGVWVNSLAFLPSSHLQAMGRPGMIARLHLIELVPFIALLWWALHAFGLVGAALAWSARCAVDGMLLFRAAGFGKPAARYLCVPALQILATYAATEVLNVSSWLRAAVWLFFTLLALVWAARAEPKAYDRLMRVTSNAVRQTLRWRAG
ncbi:flippase [Paraburkholderia sp.]|uniref:flippase n=1 Tax=Paraburkholderia sp. TaxID=1926495 RepID=UPI0025E98E9B|nr:flippase [Paraburkholderia sp.]